MKRNFDAALIRLDGTPFMDSEGDSAVPMTIKMLSFAAIGSQHPDDRNASVDQKIALYKLAAKIVDGGVVELATEELALLKDRIGKCFPPLVMGEAFRLLELDYVEPQADEAQLP